MQAPAWGIFAYIDVYMYLALTPKRRAQLEEQRRFLVAERERLYEAMRAEARRRDRLRERARGLSREDLLLLLGENLRAELRPRRRGRPRPRPTRCARF